MNGGAAVLLRIEPQDMLFFRDGRPFGAASRAASGLPNPQTVAGALRTAMLRAAGVAPERVAEGVRAGLTFGEAAAAAGAGAVGAVRFAGPWFGRNGEILYPAPATLRRGRESGEISRLDPLAEDIPGWKPPTPDMKPVWSRSPERLERVSGYVSTAGMERFLAGRAPDAGHIVKAEKLFTFHDRTGIARSPERATAAKGMIYAARMLALHGGVRLYAALSGPREALEMFPKSGVLVALGGEGRRAAVAPEPNLPAPPRGGESGEGRLVMLTTPGPFGGQRPPDLAVHAAVVPGYEAISGWDLARGGPKPNRFAARAGSVYFLPPGAAVPGALAGPEDSAVGWGGFLEGTWTHA